MKCEHEGCDCDADRVEVHLGQHCVMIDDWCHEHLAATLRDRADEVQGTSTTISERILGLMWLALMAAIICAATWWISTQTPTEHQREAFLRERIALLESKVIAERESCRQAREMSEMSETLARDVMRWMGVEEP